MRIPILAPILAALVVSGCAAIQAPKAGEDHAAHHPPGSPPATAAPAQRAAVTPDAFEKQMSAMHDMRQRMQAAKTPAERAALMDEHMKLMQSGMAMMGQMRGMGGSGGMGGSVPGGMGSMGGMGMMPPPKAGAGPSQGSAGPSGAPGMPGMGGMMGMHQQMERRMAMMEQMMQMMVDREAAVPRR